MNRRDFLTALGIGAAAVTLNGLPWPEATPIVDGVVGTPAVSLTEAFQVGDVFTIVGCYARHPITNKPTEHLQTFMVTAVAADSVSLSPSL